MKSGTKTILIVVLALLLAVAIGACAFLFFGRKDETSATIDPSMSDNEVVQYLKDQLSETQKQLTDANLLLHDYSKQIEESNKNNATLSEQNQTLNSTIQSLQETIKSLNAEVQRLTKLLEQYGDIAEGTWEVHFYDGDDLVSLLLIRNNTKITETVIAEKDGFDFLGWAAEQGGQVVDYQNITITQTTNFYAVFEKASGLFTEEGVRSKTWNELLNEGFLSISETTLDKTEKTSTLEGKLIIREGITEIKGSTFKDSLLTEIVFPTSLNIIGNSAIYNCKNLKKVFIPKDVSKIDVWNFTYCPNIAEMSVDGENATYMSKANTILKGKSIIVGCKATNLSALNEVTSIGNSAFAGNLGTGLLTIPENIMTIGEKAFADCGINSVGFLNCWILSEAAFHNCKNLNYAFIGKLKQTDGFPPESMVLHRAFLGANSSLKIYCEDSSQPSGWDSDWNNKETGTSSKFSTTWNTTYSDYLKQVYSM